jgi:hypothetical protein
MVTTFTTNKEKSRADLFGRLDAMDEEKLTTLLTEDLDSEK